MNNLINAPVHRETIRQLVRELKAYATKYHAPLLESPAVQADLAWAIESSMPYVLTKRSGSDKILGKDDERGKGKGKLKN